MTRSTTTPRSMMTSTVSSVEWVNYFKFSCAHLNHRRIRGESQYTSPHPLTKFGINSLVNFTPIHSSLFLEQGKVTREEPRSGLDRLSSVRRVSRARAVDPVLT